jgi:hypothetical protein
VKVTSSLLDRLSLPHSGKEIADRNDQRALIFVKKEQITLVIDFKTETTPTQYFGADHKDYSLPLAALVNDMQHSATVNTQMHCTN